MKKWLHKLHERIGDFWWYSLMLFCACRAADLLNAFVGLWLVPKYVDPSELGAVMPLTQFANFLAIPIAAFANTFRNEVSRLSIDREFGRLKTLMRGVFVATAIFLFLAIVVARFILPAFLERIRIVEGSLGIVVIAASFVGAVSPIYSNALQALKKFRAQSFINLISAPVRLVTMLAAMPFRALTGYFVGQTSSPAFNIVASVFALRKELSVPAEAYWDRSTLKKFSAVLAIFLAWALSSGAFGLVESTIIRQRLPDLDSASYYMTTRFSEISTYLYGALIFAFFPFAAELADKSKAHSRLILKVSGVNIAFCVIISAISCMISKPILAFLPHGDLYADYWWAIPWHIAILGISSLFGFYSTAEIAANRFGFLKWSIPLDLSYCALLLVVTDHNYFSSLIPSALTEFLTAHNVRSLNTMLWWMTAIAIIRAIVCLMAIATKKVSRTSRPEQHQP